MIVNCWVNLNKKHLEDWFPQWVCLYDWLAEQGRPALVVNGTNQQACSLDGIKYVRKRSHICFFRGAPVFTISLDVCLQASIMDSSVSWLQCLDRGQWAPGIWLLTESFWSPAYLWPFCIHKHLTLKIPTVGLPYKSLYHIDCRSKSKGGLMHYMYIFDF